MTLADLGWKTRDARITGFLGRKAIDLRFQAGRAAYGYESPTVGYSDTLRVLPSGAVSDYPWAVRTRPVSLIRGERGSTMSSKLKNLTVAALTLAALLACSGPESSSPVASSPGSMWQPAFDSTTQAFHEALRTDDTEALMAHVADDVVMMPPGEATVRGKKAMRDWHTSFLAIYRTTSFKLADRETFVANGLAIELGTYAWGLQPLAGGDSFIDQGNYMQVWKQQPGGQWLFAREIWNGSAPAPAPPIQE